MTEGIFSWGAHSTLLPVLCTVLVWQSGGCWLGDRPAFVTTSVCRHQLMRPIMTHRQSLFWIHQHKNGLKLTSSKLLESCGVVRRSLPRHCVVCAYQVHSSSRQPVHQTATAERHRSVATSSSIGCSDLQRDLPLVGYPTWAPGQGSREPVPSNNITEEKERERKVEGGCDTAMW